ncbi:hypothetical protein Btru_060277 [Bulinus truncatus]|nr:hypothetical protein Btru_060277 [Bulinus truncatus]
MKYMATFDQISSSTYRDPAIFNKVIKNFIFLYILQGVPLGFQNRFLPIYFRKRGMSLLSLWMLKLLTVTWILKPFMAFYIVEHSNNKRALLNSSYIALCFIFLVASQLPLSHYTDFIGIMFLVNLATSLQDVAMDSILNDLIASSQMSYANFAQNVCGKVGSMLSGIAFSVLADVVGLTRMFYAMAALHIGGCVVSASIVETPPETRTNSLRQNEDIEEEEEGEETLDPPPPPTRPITHHHSQQPCGFSQIWRVDGTQWGLVYLLTYKIGEFGTTYTIPLYLIDMGYSPSRVGLLTTIIGELFSIVGSIAGGMYCSKSSTRVVRLLLATRTAVVSLVWLLVITWDNTSSFYVINSQILLTLMYMIGGGVSSYSLSIVRSLVKKSPRRCRSFHCSFLITIEFTGRIVFSSLIALITELMGYVVIFGLFTSVSLFAYLWTIRAPVWLQNHHQGRP